MRKKDTSIMDNICKYIDDYFFDYHTSPSIGKIAKEIGMARSSIHRYLLEMNEIGMIYYDGKTLQTDSIGKYNVELSRADVVGWVSCGEPLLSEENILESIPLPTSLFGSGELYILKASGESMIEAGIDHGDLVVVEKQITARNGDIVVALVDNENTLKRLFKENGKVILHPENKDLEDIIVESCEIQGVARFVIKAL